MKGTIFNIQKFCLFDGDGIRTTVFLKGCPLRCSWCHNPESHRLTPQLSFEQYKCINCSACTNVCPQNAHAFTDEQHIFDYKKCIACGKCVDLCPNGALQLIGQEMTVDEVFSQVKKDIRFFENSGGGLTLSGGEPLYQFDFAYKLLELAKKQGINTCIETSGYVLPKQMKKIAQVTDTFLFDWKLTNDQLHQKHVGVSNQLVLDNLQVLNSLGKRVILRCPIVTNVNDTPDHFEGIGRLAERFSCIERVQVLPYHSLGVDKSVALYGDKPIVYDTPDDEQVEKWIAEIQQYTQKSVERL